MIYGHLDKRDAAKASFENYLAPLLALRNKFPNASDVFVNGEHIFVEAGERMHALNFAEVPDLDPLKVEHAASNAAMYAEQEFGPRAPLLSVKMPPDYRVTYARPPAADKWYLDIRFLRGSSFPLDSYAEERDGRRIMEPDDVACIKGLVTGRGGFEHRIATDGRREGGRAEKPNIAISGATGAGKTTVMMALLGEAPKDERIIYIEDTPELNLSSPATVSLMTVPGLVEMNDLLQHAMRMTPKRLVVGEVRGPEALTLLMAMRTGHDGTIFTVHSHGGEDAIDRLWDMARLANPRVRREEVASAVDYVLQMEGKGTKRRLSSIYMVQKRNRNQLADEVLER